MPKCELCQLISQRVFNQKNLLWYVLKSSQDQVQEYAIKGGDFHLIKIDVILM